MPKIVKKKEKKGGKGGVRSTSSKAPATRQFMDRRPRELIYDPRRLSVALPIKKNGAVFCIFNGMDGAAQLRRQWTLHRVKVHIHIVPCATVDTGVCIQDWISYNIAIVRAKMSLDPKEILDQMRPPPLVFTQDAATAKEEAVQTAMLGMPNGNVQQKFLPSLTTVNLNPNIPNSPFNALNALTPAELQNAAYLNTANTFPNNSQGVAALLLSDVEPAMTKTYLVQKDILFSDIGMVYYSEGWQKTHKHEYESSALYLPELYNVWVVIRPSIDTEMIAFASVEYDLDNN